MLHLIPLLVVLFCIIVCETMSVVSVSKSRKQFINQKNLDISCIKEPTLLSEIIKRLFDVIVALVVCITILPVMYIILGIIIKITSPGPIIFAQKRVGIFGKVFTCYKFRSMYQDANYDMAVKNDKRVTLVGHFIRKTHIDEFPQFYNVLIGDMSLVGPRPTMRFVTEKLDTHPKYLYRLLARPGITGMTQLKGRQCSLINKLEIDFEYMKRNSLWLDFKIIFQTLKFEDESY